MNFLLRSLSLLNVNIKLDFWTHLEAMSLSLSLSHQYERALRVAHYHSASGEGIKSTNANKHGLIKASTVQIKAGIISSRHWKDSKYTLSPRSGVQSTCFLTNSHFVGYRCLCQLADEQSHGCNVWEFSTFGPKICVFTIQWFQNKLLPIHYLIQDCAISFLTWIVILRPRFNYDTREI